MIFFFFAISENIFFSKIKMNADQKIILDIGSLFIKAGVSGEANPRKVIPYSLPSQFVSTVAGSFPTEDQVTLYTLF
jgi:actin-related protein